MIQVDECYYIPCKDRLYLIEKVKENYVLATVIMKEANFISLKETNFLGYRIYNNLFYYTNSFIGTKQLDSKVFYKICKLLELNYRNCSLFLNRATILDNSDFGYYPDDSYITLFSKRITINISPEHLFMSNNFTYYRKVFIDEATFNKIQTSCLSTISAIDEIWAQFK